MFELLQKFKTLPQRITKPGIKEMISRRAFGLGSSVELYFYMETAQFEKAAEFAPLVESGMEKYFGDNLYNAAETTLVFNLSCFFLIIKKYDKAKKWLNKILNNESLVSEDIFCFSKILYLIIYMEEDDNNIFFHHLVKSTLRYLDKRKKVYEFETVFFRFLKKISNSSFSPEEMLRHYGELHAGLMDISKDPKEKEAFNYFDFLSWVKSKIEKRDFAEILKEKADVGLPDQ